MSRDRHRMRVDFPEPESPITTKVSPRSTEKEASRTATRQPVCSSTSWRLVDLVSSALAAATLLPKIFVTPLHTRGVSPIPLLELLIPSSSTSASYAPQPSSDRQLATTIKPTNSWNATSITHGKNLWKVAGPRARHSAPMIGWAKGAANDMEGREPLRGKSLLTLAAVLAVFGLLAAGCGEDDSGDAGSADAAALEQARADATAAQADADAAAAQADAAAADAAAAQAEADAAAAQAEAAADAAAAGGGSARGGDG